MNNFDCMKYTWFPARGDRKPPQRIGADCNSSGLKNVAARGNLDRNEPSIWRIWVKFLSGHGNA